MQNFGGLKFSENFSPNKLLFQHPSELQDIDIKPPNNPTLRRNRTKTVPMLPRIRNPGPSTLGMAWRGSNARINEVPNQEQTINHRPFTVPKTKSSSNKRGNYFGLESLILLVCLTASLLILPVILPPLPPPPLLLLLVPIAIFGLLMVLAFMPCNVRDLSYS